jgi:hypothetical protein
MLGDAALADEDERAAKRALGLRCATISPEPLGLEFDFGLVTALSLPALEGLAKLPVVLGLWSLGLPRRREAAGLWQDGTCLELFLVLASSATKSETSLSPDVSLRRSEFEAGEAERREDMTASAPTRKKQLQMHNVLSIVKLKH